ncbi:hypothetical protein CE139_04495 [Pseudomonas oryzihabitans]|uniref:Uncharacterized protein n=1 Tax=Pseudomonas oryzihabitans TaxID=47885 RepID=A0A2Z5A700_9PSED|nr:hypothetical protein CE139_04495 [Pseudomonas oryzihabitans]
MSEASDDLTLRLNVKFRDGTAPTLQAELLRLPGRQRVKRLLELGSLGLMAERVISADGGTRSSPGLTAPRLDAVAHQAAAPLGGQTIEKVSDPAEPSQEVGKIPIAGVVAAVEASQSSDHQQRAEETPGLSTRPRRRPGFNVDLTG